MQLVHTDPSGLKTLWDPVNKCYCFEDSATGQVLPLMIAPQSGDPVVNGYNGPTIEALIACAAHRIGQYNSFYPSEENAKALQGLQYAQLQLGVRSARLKKEKQL